MLTEATAYGDAKDIAIAALEKRLKELEQLDEPVADDETDMVAIDKLIQDIEWLTFEE